MTLDEHVALLAKREDLCPELSLYLEQGKSFKMVRHPLLYDVPYHEHHNAFLNHMLKVKQKAVKKAWAKRDLCQYVWLHERPHRLQAFTDVVMMLKPGEYWPLLRAVWQDSENIWQNLTMWRGLLRSQSWPDPETFMNEDERQVLASLPEQVEVWRGCTVKNRNGLSWTLDEAKAKWFAQRYEQSGQVIRRVVSRNGVFAYLDGRGEREVIFLR